MLKKLIIFGLIVICAYFIYKKFMAPTMEPFFREKKGNVDFLGITTPALDKAFPPQENSR